MKMVSIKYFSAAASVFALAAVLGCGQAKHEEHAEAEEHKHGDEIVLTEQQAEAVKTETVKSGDFHGVIHTSGRVMAASCDETTVVATISGRIGHGKGHLSEGMHVTAGQLLYNITSADMQMADGDPVQRAKIDYEKAQRDYERAQLLVKDKIISDKDFQVVKAEFEAAQLTYRSTLKTRSAGGVVVAALKSGYVKQNLVKEGDYVEAGQPLMVITQNQHLYLRAEVPERHWGELNGISCAKFRTSYSDRLYDIRDMGGKVQSYGRSAETNNAYIPVIFEFNNTGDVVQGSYAEIFLITSRRENVITVPLAALTEEQGLHYVYLKVDEDGYRKQEVSLGMSDGERVEITDGLKGGEQLVVKGAIQVKLAASANVIPAHTHNH